MRRLAIVLALLLLVVPAVQAQTSTPTVAPHSHVFYQGEYAFAAHISNMTYSGTWLTITSGTSTFRRGDSAFAYVDFTVSKNICRFEIIGLTAQANGMYVVVHDPGGGGTWNVIQGTTSAFGFDFVLAEESPNNVDWQIQIINLPNGTGSLSLYTMRLWNCDQVNYTATPPNTPVPTATILPSSTPGVPTATILPSSTPAPTWTLAPSHTPPNTPVDTATAVPTATPPNTPVDTPTEINTPVDTPTEINIDPTIEAILTLIAGGPTPEIDTPTPSNTPTVTNTPTPEPRACGTLPVSGQMACFDYVVTAADVHIGNLLALVFFSVWGFFLFGVFVVWRSRR